MTMTICAEGRDGCAHVIDSTLTTAKILAMDDLGIGNHSEVLSCRQTLQQRWQ